MDEKSKKKKETIYKVPRPKLSDETAASSVDEKFFRYDMARFLGSWQKQSPDQRLDEQTDTAFQGSSYEFDFDR